MYLVCLQDLDRPQFSLPELLQQRLEIQIKNLLPLGGHQGPIYGQFLGQFCLPGGDPGLDLGDKGAGFPSLEGEQMFLV